MGVIIYSFNLNISPKMSYGVLECAIVILQNYMLIMIFNKRFCNKKGHYLCQTLYFTKWSPQYFYYPPGTKKVITISLTICPMLYFTSPWLFCNCQFVLLNLCTFFTQFPSPLLLGNCQPVLCVNESVSIVFVYFVL